MALMVTEEWGEIPLTQEVARERLPQVMEYLGYRRVEEETWQRRPDRCGSGWWSLPDACPSLLRWNLTEVEAANGSGEEMPKTRYALSYRVEMPGQILANTDAKALELEIDRILHLLIGGFDRDNRRERVQLVGWTILSNLLLSLLPALSMAAALWLARPLFLEAPLFRGVFWIVLIGGGAWGIGLALTARGVVRLLNSQVKTRLVYRSARAGKGTVVDVRPKSLPNNINPKERHGADL
ncbi:MAG: hypothetical protein KY468_02325 [Armatimonadetes bacterium]|nr:hypothetical protein [Armatimonadota bacterium]